MNILKATNLICPIEGEPLDMGEKRLFCKNGHSFDIARQGYINLLPVQHKRSKQPGDSKEMVVARTRFLNSGLYEPLAEELAKIYLCLIDDMNKLDDQKLCLMDAGCGEGYYFNYVYNYLKSQKGNATLSFIGMDISKPAIVESAKRNEFISWIVGTNRQPPVQQESVDIIACVFGFQSFEGFNKILKPGGKVILVEAGEDHLKELREIIYPQVKKSDLPDISHAEEMGFAISESKVIRFNTGGISNEVISDLLLMTPHFYRASKDGRERASNLQTLALTVDVVVRVFVKKLQ